MAAFGFNPQEVEPQEDFLPVPAGEYQVMIIKSSEEPTKNGGSQLALQFQVIDGNYKNRIIFDRITMVNANAQAQEIGRRQISALCHACGKPSAQSSEELYLIPIIVRVIVEKDEKYGDRNTVKGYKSITGAKPAATATQQKATASQHQPQPQQSNNTQANNAQMAQEHIPPQAAQTGNKPSWMGKR